MASGAELEFLPKISVIINTDGRVGSLAVCLESLKYLRYPNFEVVVVAGPTRDGTHELCLARGDEIVFAECPERNLSMSRNISIQVSSGEIVGFLDDDSVPEPEWLDDVVSAFRNPEVGVAGGFLHDHTGKSYQWRFGTLNRFGAADTSWTRAAPEFNFPGSFNYPHVMANSLFRRSAVIEVGGFDEEYEYFLDESDIILRMVDHGWLVAQLDRGFVHHKYMPSHIRNESRVLSSWYSVFKNKTYFSLVNSHGLTSVDEVIGAVHANIEEYRRHVGWAVSEKLLADGSATRFEDEVDLALRDGLSRGLAGKRRLVDVKTLEGRSDFKLFQPMLEASKSRCYVLLTRTYPPGSIGGIGRYVDHLARAMARLGHQVHVLTAGNDHDRVDFESGVWVHRICIKEFKPPAGMDIPPHIWNYSQSMFEEACEIAGRRAIDCVCAPIWDVEGIAFLTHRRFKLVTSLHTTMASYLESNPDKAADPDFLASFAGPMLALERRLMLESDGVLANSRAIVDEIERIYSMQFDAGKLSIVHHGMDDWTSEKMQTSGHTPDDMIRLCFIGRLESRKGADVLLEIAPRLIEAYPNLVIDIVGNDSIKTADGVSIRSSFETDHANYVGHPRLVFHGEVSDERLREFYRRSDIIVAPSRFESFGLVHLEAMMYGKPVIGCDIGGMQEIIEDGVSGLLAKPGDPVSLYACVARLVESGSLRGELGSAARTNFLKNFSSEQMARGAISCLNRARARDRDENENFVREQRLCPA